jgi:hypothetical protein
MADRRQNRLFTHFRCSRKAVERAAADDDFVAAIVAVAERIARTPRAGGRALLAGKCSSAVEAQHKAPRKLGLTALIPQVHFTVTHAISHQIERELFGAPAGS